MFYCVTCQQSYLESDLNMNAKITDIAPCGHSYMSICTAKPVPILDRLVFVLEVPANLAEMTRNLFSDLGDDRSWHVTDRLTAEESPVVRFLVTGPDDGSNPPIIPAEATLTPLFDMAPIFAETFDSLSIYQVGEGLFSGHLEADDQQYNWSGGLVSSPYEALRRLVLLAADYGFAIRRQRNGKPRRWAR